MTNLLCRSVVLAALAPAALAAAPAAAAPTPPASIYRFDVTITGLEAAPLTYTVIVDENDEGSVESGANIPLGSTPHAREDLSLALKLRYSLRGGVVLLSTDFSMRSPDPASSAVFRRLDARSTVPVTPGTPALLASGYDIPSHHRYQLTVAAQKLL